MHVITTYEFEANTKKYFDMASEEPVMVTRPNATPVYIVGDLEEQEDEDRLTPKEVEAIRQGFEDIAQGRTTKIEDINNIWASIL